MREIDRELKIQKIYNMNLHNEIHFGKYLTWCIKRVPGGWLYIYQNEFSNVITFVPYNEEFKENARRD